jgi:thiol:disulfide interchange protein DsbD
MLAVAVWMLSRIVPERYALLLWVIPLLALALVLEMSQLKSPAARGITRILATMAAVYAVLLGVGFSQGATDPLQPLGAAQAQARVELPFQRIKSLDDLNAQIATANASGKTVMLDFYADWCVSCKEMEKYSFPQEQVRTALANTLWLQADVTANDETDQALLKHFGIYGPPTIAFYGKDGVERREYRVVGFMKPEPFAQLVAKALQ